MADVAFRLSNGVLVATLSRAEARNALRRETLDLLLQACETTSADPDVRALLIKAEGKAFCSGADLQEWAEAEAQGALETYGWTERAHRLVLSLRALPKPAIAAIQGAAVGAGADLAFACDFRLMAEGASFRAGYLGMAYSPDMGGAWLVPRLVGEARAKAYFLRNERLGADLALQWGLAQEILPDDAFDERAYAFAQTLADGPTVALGLTKHLIQSSRERTLDTHLVEEEAQAKVCGRSRDAGEALDAAIARRAPRFQGR